MSPINLESNREHSIIFWLRIVQNRLLWGSFFIIIYVLPSPFPLGIVFHARDDRNHQICYFFFKLLYLKPITNLETYSKQLWTMKRKSIETNLDISFNFLLPFKWFLLRGFILRWSGDIWEPNSGSPKEQTDGLV